MAETPTQTFETKIKTDVAWAITHISSLLIVGGLAIVLYYVANTMILRHDEARQAADQQAYQAITSQVNDLKQAYEQDQQQTAARDVQLSDIIRQQQRTINAQNAELAKQKQINATLDAEQTAAAITTKIQAAPGEVTAQNNDVIMDLPVAIKVNDAFDELEAANNNLASTQKQLNAQVGLTQDAQQRDNDAQKIIQKQNDQLTASQKTCTDQIAVLKAKNRKHNIFVAIFSTIGGMFVGHVLGF